MNSDQSNLYINENTYITNRLDDQIQWYSSKSQSCQKKYKWLQGTEIILAAAIPVLGCIAGLYPDDCLKNMMLCASSLLGAAIAVIESICKMCKFHENWIQYRFIAELLKHEKYLYLTKTEPYDIEDRFSYLVQRVERIISSENVNWVGINEPDKKASKA